MKVIDDEKKTQELESNKDGKNGAKSKNVAWDAPYPEGVKKHKIHIPEGPEGKATSEEEDAKASGLEGPEGKASSEEEDAKANGRCRRKRLP